jgi:hypothetical protein
VACAPPRARASEGDEADAFRECHSSCFTTGCTKTPGASNTCDTVCAQRPGHSYVPPASLLLMRWECASDCAYHCMWALEGPKAAARAGPVVKYFGKWPFVRVAGAQKIASVVFSLANLAAHAHNLHAFLRLMRGGGSGSGSSSGSGARSRAGSGGGASSSHSSHGHGAARPLHASSYPYAWLWVCYALVNINAWLWSSVFHCRDTWLTERLDYFSADLVVVVGLGVAAARTLHLTSRRQLAALAALLGCALLQHVHYMAAVKFDYGYNMSLCIALGLATAAAWLVWAARSRHPGRGTLYRFMAAVHAAMLLEVLDFPPLLWLFDAHALWHAATVPLTYLWYRFIAADVAAIAAESGGGSAEAQAGGGGAGSSGADGKQKQ